MIEKKAERCSAFFYPGFGSSGRGDERGATFHSERSLSLRLIRLWRKWVSALRSLLVPIVPKVPMVPNVLSAKGRINPKLFG
jgi:hypothetical protein